MRRLSQSFRHPRANCIHGSSMVLRVSGVPSIVATFPLYLLKTWSVNKNLSTLNLTWNLETGILIAVKLLRPRVLVLTGTTEVSGIPGVPREYQVSWGTWSFTAPTSSADPRDPGITKLYWLCKHIEKIRSSQDVALSNSCTELFLRVSVKAEFITKSNLEMNVYIARI